MQDFYGTISCECTVAVHVKADSIEEAQEKLDEYISIDSDIWDKMRKNGELQYIDARNFPETHPIYDGNFFRSAYGDKILEVPDGSKA